MQASFLNDPSVLLSIPDCFVQITLNSVKKFWITGFGLKSVVFSFDLNLDCYTMVGCLGVLSHSYLEYKRLERTLYKQSLLH